MATWCHWHDFATSPQTRFFLLYAQRTWALQQYTVHSAWTDAAPRSPTLSCFVITIKRDSFSQISKAVSSLLDTNNLLWHYQVDFHLQQLLPHVAGSRPMALTHWSGKENSSFINNMCELVHVLEREWVWVYFCICAWFKPRLSNVFLVTFKAGRGENFLMNVTPVASPNRVFSVFLVTIYRHTFSPLWADSFCFIVIHVLNLRLTAKHFRQRREWKSQA